MIGLRGSDVTTANSDPAGGSAQRNRASIEDSVPPTRDSIRSDLEKLSVVEESPSGYDRSLFIHWVDDDGDGCDTRDEVLIAESEIQVEVGFGCKVSAGRWFSIYDGIVVESMAELDIDHMVPLKEAWDSGASSWTAIRRREYANDLASSNSLRAVTAASNRAKSDKDPGQWLPSNEAHICEYLSDWIAVKERWGLSVDPDEHFAILGAVSRNCQK